MPDVPPNLAYYQYCEGIWRSPLDFRLTDKAAFRSSPMSPADRLRVWSLLTWPSALGPLVMHTTVRVQADERTVLHTTRIAWGAFTFMSSAETITLDGDGRSFEMRGRSAAMPMPWNKQAFGGPGQVHDDARHATYRFDWLGTQMQQDTEAVGDGVLITQRTPWSIGVQHLVSATS